MNPSARTWRRYFVCHLGTCLAALLKNAANAPGFAWTVNGTGREQSHAHEERCCSVREDGLYLEATVECRWAFTSAAAEEDAAGEIGDGQKRDDDDAGEGHSLVL